jgi:signal transduction histidine kinase/ligand-binding sensor domain-containing protein
VGQIPHPIRGMPPGPNRVQTEWVEDNCVCVKKGILILLACCHCAFALNPSLDINQYAHKAWTVRDGFFKGSIVSIAQTRDGYLWLGTEFGLLRFDGVRSIPWQSPTGEKLPSTYTTRLLAARDGRLWIGTRQGLASWKDGKLTHYPALAGQSVVTLLEDREGTIWAGAGPAPGRLCAIQSASAQCYGEDGRFGSAVSPLYEDSAGNLWAETAAGLWRWKPGPPKLYPLPDPALALIESDKGTLLIAMRAGIRQLVDGKAEAYPLPGAARRVKPTRLLRDHDGGLWIGTIDRGLLHIHEGRTDTLGQPDGLSGDYILDLFEDREGNIWVATSEGLDRFRDFAVPTISVKQGLSDAVVGPVVVARDGSVWLGASAGLNRWRDGQVTIYRKGSRGLPDDALESLYQDDHGRIWAATGRGVVYFENGRFNPVKAVPGRYVHSIAGDRAGNLWISHQYQGLFHLLEASVVEQISWSRLGRKDYAQALLPDPEQGGLWLGFRDGGVAYFKDGQIRASYTSADGLGEGRVESLQLDLQGTLWAATEGGLSRIKNGRAATLTSKNGLPCDTVHWVVEDDDHAFWLYTACGLARIARPELDAWAADPRQAIRTTVFDSSDGVRSRASSGAYSPAVAKSADGKIWFLPLDGVSVIDPHHLPLNKLPPPVHIEQITADRKTYDASSNRRLPALTRDLEIDYTALSLVAPEKNRFKYKLEGYDRDWQDVGNRRQAFYDNLSPRSYRFRVIASNNSGVWNEAGASLDFSIAPAYYQTMWFRLSCAAAFLALLAVLYRLRLRQVAQHFNLRMEARVNERTRIARDLHDTLLQSFQGVLLKFHAVTYMLPDRPEARKSLEGVIEQARQAITEGRDAVEGLRSSVTVTNDLAQAIRTIGEGLAADQDGQNCPEFRVQVEGESRDLAPLLRDEIFRIASEALRNAFLHAHARRIEVEIRYGQRQLRIRVRDDGRGIEQKVLDRSGRAGHYGLPGMHERAKLMSGKLEVWSEPDSGTEIELTVPGPVVYAKPAGARRWIFAGKA